MTPPTDPSLWQSISGWLWAVLAIPLGILWKKSDGSIQKEDLRLHVEDDAETHKQLRETMKNLFANAEEDRRRSDDKFSRMQENIHSIHVQILDQIRGMK